MKFVPYKVVPSASRPGKTDKLPLDWRTGNVADAQDPANHLTQEAAELAVSMGTGVGVGLVLTPEERLWCVDIDNCLQADGNWSPIAIDLCDRLAGAYIEVSVSGRGLHIIGTGDLPPHGTRNGPLGLELYSKGRFIALTGTHATGDMTCDLTPVIAPLALQYFPPSAGGSTDPSEWTEGPCEGWAGPLDDGELISKMLSVKSAAAAFGGAASPRDLWEANEAALAKAFPDTGDRAYDASRADAALAQRLAFWTGRDCERMERLMLRSGLTREKWEQRPEYLRGTITRACGQQRDVATGRKRTDTVSELIPDAPAVPVTAPASYTGFVTASDMPTYFKNCVYIEDQYVAATPDGELLTPQQFRTSTRYGGAKFMLDTEKTTRNAWEAFTESAIFTPPTARGIRFRPDEPPRALIDDNGRIFFNCYVPIKTPSTPGDASLFLQHMQKLLPVGVDSDLLLYYMAAVVQNLGYKIQWAPLVQGCPGNGKSALINIMVRAIGERYCHLPNALDLHNKFNPWIENKLFIGIEEAHVPSEKREVTETMKPMITNPRIEIQGKGRDQYTGDNRANFFLTSNYKDAVPKTRDDRRYGIFFTAQQSIDDLLRDGMDQAYFTRLYDWLNTGGYAVVTHFLQHLEIPAAMNPTKELQRAPDTSSTLEAIKSSRGPVEQLILEAIGNEAVGFRGGWASGHYLSVLLEDRRLRNRCLPQQWDALMTSLGYTRHPALRGGRTDNIVTPDGVRTRLWVKNDSIAHLNLESAAQVAAAYSAVNGTFGVTRTA